MFICATVLEEFIKYVAPGDIRLAESFQELFKKSFWRGSILMVWTYDQNGQVKDSVQFAPRKYL